MDPRSANVSDYLRALQDRITARFAAIDGEAQFVSDRWQRDEGGGGDTRVLAGGHVFEKAGVGFSHIRGTKLPPSASVRRPQLAGRGYEALGVSLVMHPQNPYAPTAHMNVRLFYSAPPEGERDARPVWWFGGGFDLTPYYGFRDDAVHWHRCARDACAVLGADAYPVFKRQCDEYFFIPHRNEARGIGGLFFDDLDAPDFDTCFAFMQSVGDGFIDAYAPIVERRTIMPYGKREKDFQLLRRGRYVEFNLVYDRGTLFGLQSAGRTESILMSLPPAVHWQYGYEPEPGSAEAKLHSDFLPPQDWLAQE